MSIWIHGIESLLIRDVHSGTACADIYHHVAQMHGIPSHMLVLSNGVQVLRRKHQLCNYMSASNLTHGVNLQCNVKCPGGGSGDELGEGVHAI